jgi:hypothetical protein
LIFSISHSQGDADCAPFAPTKVLKSDAAVLTKRRSSRAPRAAGSAATATSEGVLSVVAAVEPQQVVAALTAAMTTAVTAPSIPPVPTPVDDSQAAVVEIPDEDTLPPGWDQWGNLPTPAPELLMGVLVVRDDGGVAPGHPADGAEASSSRAVLPTSDGAGACPEQKRERADAPPDHFANA